MREPKAEQFKRQSGAELRQMHKAGQARPADATNLHPGACYLCSGQFAAGEGRVWKLQGAIRGARLLCLTCDAEVRMQAPAEAFGDGQDKTDGAST